MNAISILLRTAYTEFEKFTPAMAEGFSAEDKGGFIDRALQKILAEKETKRSSNAKLRQACEAALG